jgi:hypothetical protein
VPYGAGGKLHSFLHEGSIIIATRIMIIAFFILI